MTIETLAATTTVAPLQDEPQLLPEIICGELRIGRILTTVPVVDGSWSLAYNDAGRVTATVPLASLDADDAREVVGYLDPARCFLAVRVGDRIVEAGPIWRHDYDDDTGDLTVTAAGLWSLFDHRRVMKVLAGGESPAASVLAWSGLSLGTIAKRLVETAMSHAGGSLPLVLPPDEVGGHERIYPGYELKQVGEVLRQLTEVIGGPDIRFEPRLTADRLRIEWVMRVGTEAQPLIWQSGGDWQWDTTVPGSGVSGLSVSRDATRLGYRAWGTGSGQEAALPMSMREDLSLTGRGFPLLEVDESRSQVSEQTTLDAHTEALLARSVRPWVTWSWRAREHPSLWEQRPGDWATLRIPRDHRYLSALGFGGDYRARIVGMSGDLGPEVTFSAAPTMEHRQ